MIGCDIVKISRFKKNLEKLKNRILTVSEQEEFNNTSNKLEYIAGRWAAKEAIFKAVGKLSKLSILKNKQGAPYVVGRPDIKLSISHEKEYCISVAIIYE